jgi:hypothetical protein
VSKETTDAIALYANIATIVVVFFTAVALLVAAQQLWAARRGTSAGAYIALNESFRQAWLHFSNVDEQGKQHAFSDIMNLLESACAIFEDKIFIGKVGTLLEDYLCHVFILIQQSDDARNRIERMMVTYKTFAHIVRFIAHHRNQIHGITLPASPEANTP